MARVVLYDFQHAKTKREAFKQEIELLISQLINLPEGSDKEGEGLQAKINQKVSEYRKKERK